MPHVPTLPIDDDDLNTSLLLAAFEGQSRRVSSLIERGADVNCYDDEGLTPLHWTSLKGFDDLSKILIERGADVNWVSTLGSPLCFAALRGHFSGVQLLLAQRASPFSSNTCPLGTPLHCAAWSGDMDIVKVILGASKKSNPDWIRTVDEQAFRLVDRLVETYRGDCSDSDSENDGEEDSDDDEPDEGDDETNDPQGRTDIEPETLTPLMIAAYRGHLDVVKLLVSRGANVKSETRGRYKYHGAIVIGSTPLICAAAAGRLEVLKYMISQGAEVDKAQHDGFTPLMAAAFAGSSDCAAELLRLGASTHSRSSEGYDALMMASACMRKQDNPFEFAAVVELLLAYGMDANAKTADGQTALMFMGRAEESEDNVAVAQMLIDAGADIDTIDKHGCTALVYTARKAPSVASLLLEKGADVAPASNSDGMSALHTAALFNHDGLILELHARGAQFDWQSLGNNTALMLAAGAGNLASVKLIVELCGSEQLDAVNANNMTALMYACARGFSEIASVLLDAGAHAQAKDLFHAIGHRDFSMAEKLLQHGASFKQDHRVRGQTPLHWAASSGYCQFIRLFLEHGAEINSLDDRGSTPISHAAVGGKVRAVEVLLEAGADPKILDSGRHPLDTAGFACSSGQIDVLEVLVDHGIDLNKRYKNGDTLLCVAALSGRLEVVNYLLEQGADPNLTNDNGDTALSYAENSDHEDAEEIALSLWGRMDSPQSSPEDDTHNQAQHLSVVPYQQPAMTQAQVSSVSFDNPYQYPASYGPIFQHQQHAAVQQQQALYAQTWTSTPFFAPQHMPMFTPHPYGAYQHSFAVPAFVQQSYPAGSTPYMQTLYGTGATAKPPSTYGLLKYASHTYVTAKIEKRRGSSC